MNSPKKQFEPDDKHCFNIDLIEDSNLDNLEHVLFYESHPIQDKEYDYLEEFSPVNSPISEEIIESNSHNSLEYEYSLLVQTSCAENSISLEHSHQFTVHSEDKLEEQSPLYSPINVNMRSEELNSIDNPQDRTSETLEEPSPPYSPIIVNTESEELNSIDNPEVSSQTSKKLEEPSPPYSPINVNTESKELNSIDNPEESSSSIQQDIQKREEPNEILRIPNEDDYSFDLSTLTNDNDSGNNSDSANSLSSRLSYKSYEKSNRLHESNYKKNRKRKAPESFCDSFDEEETTLSVQNTNNNLKRQKCDRNKDLQLPSISSDEKDDSLEDVFKKSIKKLSNNKKLIDIKDKTVDSKKDKTKAGKKTRKFSGSSVSQEDSDEYVPNEEDDDSTDDSDISERNSDESNKSSELEVSNKAEHSYDCKKDLNNSSTSQIGYVAESSEGGKWYAKENCCPYCHKLFKRLDAHLKKIHQDKKTVQETFCSTTSSQRRRELLAILRRKGNAYFNQSKQLNPTGKIIAVRRLAKNRGKPVPRKQKESQIKDLNCDNNQEKSSLDQQNQNEKSNKLVDLEKPQEISPNEELDIEKQQEINSSEELDLEKQKEIDLNKKLVNESDKKGKYKHSSVYEEIINETTKMPKVSEKVETSQLDGEKKCKISEAVRLKCNKCDGYFAKSAISRHYKEFHGEKEDLPTRNIIAVCRRETNQVHKLANTRMRKDILPYLYKDDVGNTIRFDKYIIMYGNQYCDRHFVRDQDDLIRSHLRYLAKLLLQMKEFNEDIKTLEQCFKGRYYDDIIKSTRILAGYSEKTNLLDKPSVAQTIGMLIRRMIDVLKADYSKQESNEKLNQLAIFEAQFKNSFSTSFSSKIALSQNIQRRTNNTKKLPSTSDIKIFKEYLLKKLVYCLNYLKTKGFKFEYWLSLLEVCMIKIQNFNRRRPGESDRTSIADFENRISCTEKDEFYKKLECDDKKQLQKYEKMETKGKKINGIDGTVYLTEIDVEGLKLILKYRKEAGVPKNNTYLFGLPNPYDSRLKHASSYQTQVKLVNECHNYKKLNDPDAIRSTLLRKHCATKFNSLNKKEDFEAMTHHMAHSSKTHNAHYLRATKKTDVNVTRVLEKINGMDDSSNISEHEEEDNFDDISQTSTSKIDSQQDLLDVKERHSTRQLKKNPDSSCTSSKKLSLKSTKKPLLKNTSKTMQQSTKSTKVRWTPQEEKAFNSAFDEYLLCSKLPSSSTIEKAMDKYPCLRDRGIKRIKAKCCNIFRKQM